MPNRDPKVHVLNTARQLVTRNRRNVYGSARDEFSRLAEIVNALWHDKLAEPLTADDMVTFMVALKLKRHAAAPTHLDTIVDLAGYAALLGEVNEVKLPTED